MISPETVIRIDAHHHLWDRERLDFDYHWLDTAENTLIRQSHLPADLKPQMDANQIGASVVVQTQHCLAENDWALELSQRFPWIAGVVGWIDLQTEQCEAQLQRYADSDRLVGIRHVIQDEPDDFVVRPNVLANLRVLERHQVPFDLLVYQRQLHHAPTVARHCPDLKIVLDHLGKPDVAAGAMGLRHWQPLIQAAAQCDNVYCKLSGLVTEANWNHWTAQDLKPFFLEAIECFGPQRCMFGSDWPVCRLAGEYHEVVQAFDETIASLSPTEQQWLQGGTASQFYGLNLIP